MSVKSFKSFKYRLYPTKKQRETLQWTLDRCRELYNAALQERRDAYKMCQISITFAHQSAQLPEIKRVRQEYQDIYAQVLQNVLHRLDKAFKAFFRRVKEGEKPGYPRYQGERRYDSFTYPQDGFSITHDNRICLSKIGSIKVKLHRPLQGRLKTCTVKREGWHWYVIFACEVVQTARLPYTDLAVGIDLGVTHFAALSSGDFIDNPRYFRKATKKLARLQQSASRKKRGSNRRKKTVKQIAKAHRKVCNQRADFLHQWSRKLVNTYEMIVFEELAPSNMSKRPKPKQDESGVYLPKRHLRGRTRCQALQDVYAKTAEDAASTRPDLLVTCTLADWHPAHVSQTYQRARSPLLVVEILSPSTESLDRGENFERYCKCQTLEIYLLVHQEKPLVEVRRKSQNWQPRYVQGNEHLAFTAGDIQFNLDLGEIYEGLFPPLNEEP